MIIYPINKRKVSASGKFTKYLKCSLLAICMFLKCLLLAICMCLKCSLHAICMCLKCSLLAICTCLKCSLLAARHLYVSKVLAARKKNLTTSRARKNKHTIRMLANARKDHSILLIQFEFTACELRMKKSLKIGAGKLIAWNDIIFCPQEVTFLREEKPFFRNPSTRDVPIPSAQRNSLVVQS